MKAKVQLELSDRANEVVSIFKLRNNLKKKSDAINQLLEMKGDDLE